MKSDASSPSSYSRSPSPRLGQGIARSSVDALSGQSASASSDPSLLVNSSHLMIVVHQCLFTLVIQSGLNMWKGDFVASGSLT